jgi:anti-sigma factor RsiW
MTSMDYDSHSSDRGGDVAAYALGALDQEETEAFRAHLESCVVCRDELAAFERVVGVLPMAAPQHRAPAGLRERVLDAVNRESRLESVAAPEPRSRRSWGRLPSVRSPLALGAALTVLAIVAVAVVLGSSGARQTRVFDAQVKGPGSARLTLGGGHAELSVRHFAAPPAGEIYEVWLGRPGRAPAPTRALFGVTTNGDATVDVPGNLAGVNVVMVTPEPAGGTLTPTHPPVIVARLSRT